MRNKAHQRCKSVLSKRGQIFILNRLIHLSALCVFMLIGCGPRDVLVDETDPFTASKRHVADREWEHALQKAEALLQERHVSSRRLTDHMNELMERVQLARDNHGIAASLKLRKRNAVILDRLRARQRVQDRIAHWPHHTFVVRTAQKVSFSWPLKNVHIVSGFGIRLDPFGTEKHVFHDGVDLAATVGTSVHSPARGRVITAGYRADGCGLGVTIAHPDRYVSDYCHLQSIGVKATDTVEHRQFIGRVGVTGRTLGPHLHWSLWHRGKAVDPGILMGNDRRAAHAK